MPFFTTRPLLKLVTAVAVASTLCAACGASSAKGAPTASRKTPTAPLVWSNTLAWEPHWSLDAFGPSFPSPFTNLVVLPLAITNPNKFGTYVPELATSWQSHGNELTVNLRRNAKWQNGKPVTSRDVLTTLLLLGTQGSAVWNNLAGVATPNAHQIRFTLRGEPPSLAETAILPTVVEPASVYSRFVPTGLEHELLRGGSAATQQASIAAAAKRLASFNPPRLVGDGPYKLVSINLAAATLTKWAGFWDAKRIHVRNIRYENPQSDTSSYGILFGGDEDYTSIAMTSEIVARVKKTRQEHYVAPPAIAGNAVYFNARHYPLNLTGVRQAIAYILNRPAIVAAGFGEPDPMHPTPTPTGLAPLVTPQWLTQTDLQHLNSYTYNPNKASTLLRSLRFKKASSGWLLPNGKPFTLTINGPAGDEAIPEEISTIAKELDAFGIKTTATAIEQPGYWTYQDSGNFELDWGWTATNGSLDPLSEIAAVLANINFVTSGTQHEDGIGFGPTEDVPGLGTVNVPQILQKQETTVGPGARMRQLTYDWVKEINQQVPFVQFNGRVFQIAYSTKNYVDWPKKTSPLWKFMSVQGNTAGVLVAMEHGYIRPKA